MKRRRPVGTRVGPPLLIWLLILPFVAACVVAYTVWLLCAAVGRVIGAAYYARREADQNEADAQWKHYEREKKKAKREPKVPKSQMVHKVGGRTVVGRAVDIDDPRYYQEDPPF